jgi:NADH-quinone oxidoreductase subunit M
MYGLPFLGGMTIIWAYYMLKMYQQVMLGETNTKKFKDVTLKKVCFGCNHSLFFGMYPKPITDLITQVWKIF